MLKKLNQFLKLFGFNLVHARRSKVNVPPVLPRRVRAGDGLTHFGGDGCVPPHDLTGFCDRPRVKQPASDPNITGPTS